MVGFPNKWATIILIIFAHSTLIVGCGKKKDTPKKVTPELAEMVEDFKDEARSRGIRLNRFKVNFDNITGYGICYLESGQILINEVLWNESNNTEKRWIIYHELGHCALGVDRHINDLHPLTDCPLSILNQYPLNYSLCGQEVELNWNQYLDDLFAL